MTNRAQLQVAAIEVDGIRDEIVQLIARYPDAPPDALLRLVEVTKELDRIVDRLAEVAERYTPEEILMIASQSGLLR